MFVFIHLLRIFFGLLTFKSINLVLYHTIESDANTNHFFFVLSLIFEKKKKSKLYEEKQSDSTETSNKFHILKL